MPKEAKKRPPRIYKNKKGDKTYYLKERDETNRLKNIQPLEGDKEGDKKKDKKYYLKEGKQRIKAHDINLVINNILSNSRRARRPIGRQNAAKLAKEALAKEELKYKAQLEEQKLKHQQQTDLMTLRIKQIKEEAQAKNERETQALRVEHERERKEHEALKQLEEAKKILEIENIKNEALKKEIEIQQQHNTLLRRAEEAERQNLDYQARFAEEKYGEQLAQGEQKQLEREQQLNAVQQRELENRERLLRELAQVQVKEAEELGKAEIKLQEEKKQIIINRIEEDKKRAERKTEELRIRAEEERRRGQIMAEQIKSARDIRDARQISHGAYPEVALVAQIAQAELAQAKLAEEKQAEPPNANFPRELAPILGGDLQYDEAPLPAERQLPNRDIKVGQGNKERVSSLQYGMTEQQLNNFMDDEPRFLKTVASDEIPSLAHSAKIIDDDYEGFGFIINLDKRDEDKYQHWVACYIDTDHGKEMCYYDPFGDPPTETINNGLKKLIQSLNLPYYLEAKYNMNKTQNLNSNRCGMHCMKFLRDMFAGEEFEEATNHNEREVMQFQKGLIGQGEPDLIKYI